MSDAQTLEQQAREVFKAAMVDAARKRGGAGAEFIAKGETNLWLDIAYDAAVSICRQQPLPGEGEVEYPTAFSISKRRHENKNSSAALKGGD